METNDGNAIKGFWITGEYKVWHTANAEIKNNAMALRSPQVSPHPVVLRYAFTAFSKLNLINKR